MDAGRQWSERNSAVSENLVRFPCNRGEETRRVGRPFSPADWTMRFHGRAEIEFSYGRRPGVEGGI